MIYKDICLSLPYYKKLPLFHAKLLSLFAAKAIFKSSIDLLFNMAAHIGSRLQGLHKISCFIPMIMELEVESMIITAGKKPFNFMYNWKSLNFGSGKRLNCLTKLDEICAERWLVWKKGNFYRRKFSIILVYFSSKNLILFSCRVDHLNDVRVA